MPTQRLRFQLGDHLSSITATLGSAADVFNREEYLPYGETAFGSYARKRYRYTSRERDGESGLCYHRARYYAPWLARWISADPDGLVDSLNTYDYAKNSPLTRVDNHGTQSTLADRWSAAGLPPGTPGLATQLQLGQGPRASTGWGPILHTGQSTPDQMLPNVSDRMDWNTTEHLSGAAQDLTWFSLFAFGGELLGPVMAAAPRSVQTPLAVLSAAQGAREVHEAATAPDLPWWRRAEKGALGLIGLVAGAVGAGKAAGVFRPATPAGAPKSSEFYIPRGEQGEVIPLEQRRVDGIDIPLPDKSAEGPHTVLGGRVSETGGVYRQSATFPEAGNWPAAADGQAVPNGRVDWTNHPSLPYTPEWSSDRTPIMGGHPDPHIHPIVFDVVQKQWVELPLRPFPQR